jgi:uncharacterized protein YyaL (SSP411 family)
MHPASPLRAPILAAAFAVGLFAGHVGNLQGAEAKAPAIPWVTWKDDIFTRAKAENRLVLLDLGAGWCHWCHVMDEITYQDPEVIRLINEKYIPVRMDQDQRPDLSNRYEEYGWPATIVFAPDGKELAKRSGYIPPKPMASMLQAFIDDPTPGPSVEPEAPFVAAKGTTLTDAQRAAMLKGLDEVYDTKRGGWGTVHHFLDWDAIQLCLDGAVASDAQQAQRARQTLTGGLKLLDPVWGGVYQYSTDGDWDHPHFEKIMPFQAENLRIFAQAYALWQEPVWLQAAEHIRTYLKTFLTTPDGAFCTSQDADVVQGEHSAEYFQLDDAGRRKAGIPRVDTHIYARENGLAITGLAALYAVNGDAAVLADALKAAEWTLAHRALAGGGFRHDEADKAGPYLADSLAMGRAFLQLHAVTAERRWLTLAAGTAAFIQRTFKAEAGYDTSVIVPGAPFRPRPQLDENIMLARFSNLLYHYSGVPEDRSIAEHSMRYLVAPATLERRGWAVSGILIADNECRHEPQHITIVGGKDDPLARALFAKALCSATAYKRVEWFDAREGPLPHQDVEYPTLPRAAAFFCTEGRCSAPVSTVEALAQKLPGQKRKN